MIYRNNLKNREDDEEAAQIFASGARGIAREQAASEDQKFAAKPTQSETDSSGYFGIPYDIVLGLGLLAFLPRVLWRKKLSILRQRLRSDAPDAQGKPVIWLHAVSLGEIKSAKGLAQKLKSAFPDSFLLVTTATAAGFEEAFRSLKEADSIRFMPLDFRWIVRKWVARLKPTHLIFVESDFWFQLLREVKRRGGRAFLVSGKLSERSAKRFSLIPRFAKNLFSLFDLILVQNEEYRKCFLPFTDRVLIGGNLKLDAIPEQIDSEHWSPIFKTMPFKIAIISTHAPEEEELLDALQPIAGTLFLAPRHPERFGEVAQWLQSKKIPYCRWSKIEERTGQERVILVDAMGQLPLFYTFCDLAIVAGSFSSRVGGHNVLEPCLYGAPVFFGPHMRNQKEFAALVLDSGAGRQVSLENLITHVADFAQEPFPMRAAAAALGARSGGALQQTWKTIEKLSWQDEKTWE